MQKFVEKLKVILKDPVMLKRIGFVFFALFLFRVLAAIPIPGIDTVALQKFLTGNQLFGLFDIFSGGGISHFSIVMLGVGPYITGSIIMQLLTMMSPRMKAMFQEEGERGRLKLAQYSRLLAVPLAAIQALGFIKLLQSQNVMAPLSATSLITNIIVITGGSMLLMWIGELISEFGIGNGVSLIIFAGIVAALPTRIGQFFTTFDPSQLPMYLVALAVGIIVIVGVVYVSEAERSVPVTYAKQVRGNKVYGGVSTYLPLRLNQAGVIPIIFALSIMLFPRVIANFLSNASNHIVASLATGLSAFLANPWFYDSVYFIFVVLFTYFYTAVTFDPKMISENLQKGGAFIPGIRPGEATMLYLGKVVTRITLVGAIFLGIVAILPLIMQAVTNNSSMAIGGTALLIVVSVVLDLVKRADAQVAMREY